MDAWTRWLPWNGTGRVRIGEGHVLPYDRDPTSQTFPAREVTRVALRLKHQLEQIIPFEIEQDRITAARSSVLTPAVVETARSAGKTSNGKDHSACVVYCLLVNIRWFKKLALLEPWDSELHAARATACEVLAQRIIESEEDMDYLMEDVLLKRYSTIIGGDETTPANVIEHAIDRHALRVIGSSGYQKCVSYLYRGWLVQDEADPNKFITYKNKTSTNYWDHFDPDRLHVPRYQSMLQVAFSVIYLILYSISVNSVNETGRIDPIEALLYLFTLGFVGDELVKIWKVGTSYIGFWNAFNLVLYTIVTWSFIVRCYALSFDIGDHNRLQYDGTSYRFLAFAAPMFWGRLLLYLDGYRFFGAMLIIVKVMMKESLIFFALLVVVWIGFLQAFIGLDEADDTAIDASRFIFKNMINAMLGAADFGGFGRFAPPFGITLYYIYNFIIVVILLNVLVALYNSAYSQIYDNATDEYLALFAMKTTQFVRAPDTNVYIPPLNIVEWLLLPLELVLSKRNYERLNDVVMGLLYSPLLVITAAFEVRDATRVTLNRKRGEADDDDTQEWEQMAEESAAAVNENDGWSDRVEQSKPDLTADALKELQALRKELAELKSDMKKD